MDKKQLQILTGTPVSFFCDDACHGPVNPMIRSCHVFRKCFGDNNLFFNIIHVVFQLSLKVFAPADINAVTVCMCQHCVCLCTFVLVSNNVILTQNILSNSGSWISQCMRARIIYVDVSYQETNTPECLCNEMTSIMKYSVCSNPIPIFYKFCRCLYTEDPCNKFDYIMKVSGCSWDVSFVLYNKVKGALPLPLAIAIDLWCM